MKGYVSILLLQAGLLTTGFLWVLNGHLRSRKKVLADVVLGGVWVSLLLFGFIFFAWRVGVASFVLSFFYALISKPAAVLVARRKLGYFTTFRAPWISSDIDLCDDALLAAHKETERRIIPISERPSITKVLSKYGMEPEDLGEQFHFLVEIGLGAVARKIISKGRKLNRLLRLRRRNLAPEKIAARLIRWQWFVFALHMGLFHSAVNISFF